MPHALALAVTVPSAPTCRHRVPVPPAEEIMSAEVDATVVESVVDVAFVTLNNVAKRFVAVRAVVEAYGSIEATEEVEVMFPAMNWLPCIESAEPGVVVPTPTLPAK